MAYFGDGRRFGSEIEYSVEAKPLGTAGPLGQVHGLDETFLVMNGDLLTDLDFTAMIAGHRSTGAAATVGLYSREVRIDLGVVETDCRSIVRAYIEKPVHRYDVSMGVYVLEPAVLRHIPVDERFELPALVHRLMDAEEPVHGYKHRGYWLDIGRPDDYQQAQDDFPTMRAALIREVSHSHA
jgi:NDP-mannose synthase